MREQWERRPRAWHYHWHCLSATRRHGKFVAAQLTA